MSSLPVKHISYQSIESFDNEKFFNRVAMEGKTDGEWIVTEKIHGANFCIIVPNEDNIYCSRRKSLISEEENFYNWQNIKQKYSADAFYLYKELLKKYENTCNGNFNIRIYGELYGGYYPGIGTDENCTRVQKGIYYAPYNDIIVFDIKVGDNYLDYHEMKTLCESTSLRITEPLLIGTFKEVITYDPLFETTLPKILGFEQCEDNIAEGVVIKPNKSTFLSNGTRIIIKKKNARFAEITGVVKTKKSKKKTYVQNDFAVLANNSEELINAHNDLKRYFNENRLEAVISKIGQVTLQDTPKLRGLLTQDALKDFIKISEHYNNLSPVECNLLKKKAPLLAIPIITNYFKEN